MVTRTLNRLVAACVVGAALSVGSAAPAAAALTASLSPTSGPPGTSVTVSGAGFDAQVSVDVFFDTSDIALAASNASGAVSTSVQIPKSAQPGTHWITLKEAAHAAQAQFTVVASWPQGGYGPSGRSFNPLENTVDPSNADQLAVAWSTPVTTSGNVKPFVILRGNAYVFDEAGVVHAYSSTGALLWRGVAGTFRQQQVAPAANGSSLFTGNVNGVVRAWPSLCRTDGGVCTTTQWTRSIGTQINGLTLRNGLLYASGQDGLIHVINAGTGAPGTSLTPLGSGAVTRPVAFAADGSAWIVQGTQVTEMQTGVTSHADFGSTVSAPAVSNTDGYVTTADGNLHQAPLGWTTSIGTTGCGAAPAFAKGVVYAASCTTIGAYNEDTGAARWSITVPGAPRGLAVANGVLYACWGSRVRAYQASNGVKLGSGGRCDAAPEIVNGTLYAVGSGSLFAATLDGAIDTVSTPRPDPSQLRPSPQVRLRMH